MWRAGGTRLHLTPFLTRPVRRQLPLLAALALGALMALPAPTASAVLEAAPDCGFPRAAPESLAPDLLGGEARDHPVALSACTGLIRPGAGLGNNPYCTLNFVFTDSRGTFYIGTAGHCIDRVGERVSTPGVGQFGTAVYRVSGGIASDFGLIRIDADKAHLVNPTMCQWGGPIGAADPGSLLPRDLLFEYGWGFTTSAHQATRARVQVVHQETRDWFHFNGEGSGGDSGAPLVNQAGYAVGIHTTGLTPLFGVVQEGGPTISRVLTLGRTAVPTLQLVTGDPTSLQNQLGDLTYG